MYQVHCVLLSSTFVAFFFFRDDILISPDNRFILFFFGTIATIIYTKVMAYCISSPWFYHVQDPGALKCCGCNDEFQKRHPMVDDRVLDIVKRIGLKGLHRTLSREIDHNLITAFVER